MTYYTFYKDGKYKSTGNPVIALKGLDPDRQYLLLRAIPLD